MSVDGSEVGDQALTFAQAIGLIDGDGNLDSSWFEDPLGALADVLSDTEQRDATVELLDLLLPETQGAPDGWRQIVAEDAFRVYLTTNTSGGSLTIGVAGRIDAPEGVRIDVEVPLLDAPGAGSDPDPIVGTADGPIRIELHVPVDLAAPPVGLRAIEGSVEMYFEPTVDVRPVVELIGLQLGGAPASDRRFDTEDLGGDVVDLVIGLLQDALDQPGVPSQIADHLLPLLGLGDGVGAIPELPILRLPTEPVALRDWLQTLVEGPGLGEWLGHLAGLLDAPPAVGGAGTRADPWRVALFHDTHVALEATAAVYDGRIWPGVEIRAGENQSTDTTGMHMVGQAVIMGLPYIGVGEPEVAPDVRFLVRSPTPLVDVGGAFSCGRLEAGISWDGSDLVPMLELVDVDIDGATHPRIDLTQTEEIAGLAASAVEAALRAVVGDGPGVSLLALAGVIPPSTAPATWPHQLDIPQFLVDPIGAIGAYHRGVLEHGTHTWAALHAEIASLLGLAGVSGTGTEADPWRFALAASGAIEIRIDAWRVSGGGMETVRLGLAVGFQEVPFQAIAVAQLIALEIPASGGPSLEVGAKVAAQLSIDPLPAPPDMGGFSISASSIAGSVAWAPGSTVAWDVRIEDILVGLPGGGAPTFDLRFPTNALDFSDPAATAAGLGLDTAQLDAIVRGLVWRAARSWGGRDGQLLATLLGFGAGTWDLPDDFPQLGGSAGTLLTDPLGSVRPWLLDLVRAPGSDGVVPIAHLIHLLHAWAEKRLPADFAPFLAEEIRRVTGAGTPDDPWCFDVDGSRALEVCAWAGPEGPALPALPGLSGGDADVIADIAAKLRDGVGVLGAALDSDDAARFASGLEELEAFFQQSDGVVPIVSQQPEGWTTPAPLDVTHVALPGHADAIAAIRQHVADQADSPVTLLLSAPFLDRTSWDALLSSGGLPGTTDPTAHFHFRVPDIPASGVDLTTVAAVADWYTADLDDAADIVSQEAQIGRVLDRLDTLVPGRSVVLVAHSTTGNAARRVAASTPGRIAGIVSLGTPHLGARPAWATGEAAGLALRTARSVLGALPAGTLRDAISDAIGAVDRADGAPWTPAFFNPADVDTGVGAVPALAIAGQVGGGLLDAVEAAIRDLLPGDRAAPTYIGLKARAALGTSFRTHDLGVRATAEIDLGRIGLPGAAAGDFDPTFTVRVDLDGAGGWLVGGAGMAPDGTPWGVSCRRATLRVTVSDGTADFAVELVGTADGIPDVLGLDHPRASEILDRAFERLSEAPGAAALLADLQAIGLAVRSPDGGVRLSTDAVEALRTNGLDWLRPRVQTAFETGLAAFPTDGLDLGLDLPVRLEMLTAPTRLRLSTVDDGLVLGDRARLNGHVDIGLPGGALSYAASIAFDGLSLAVTDGTVTVSAGSWMDPLPLFPADAAAFQSRLEDLLPRLVFSAATTALAEATLPEGMRIGPLDRLLMGSSGASGGDSGEGAASGPIIPAEALVPLLRILNGALGNAPSDSLELPADLRLEVVDTGTATRVQLRTDSPLGGIVGLQLGVDLTAGPAATPAASISVGIPDPGGGTLVDVAFSHGAAGTGLSITPTGASPITLLPTFSGFGSILAGGAALLPRALDELDGAIAANPVKTAVLDVATELEIYSSPGGFAPNTARFQELLDGGWNRTATQQAAVSAAVRAVVGQIPALPGSVGGTGTELSWSVTIPGPSSGLISLGLDWVDDGPVFTAGVDDLRPDGAPVLLDAVLSVTPSGPTPFDLSVAASITDLLGLPIRPTIEAGASPTGVVLSILPLATAGDAGPLDLTLLPEPDVEVQPDLGERVVVDVAFPLLLSLIDRAVGTDDLWAGGPTVREILLGAGLIDGGGSAVLPFPEPLDVLAGALGTLSVPISIGDLELVIGNVGGGLGVGANGKLEIPLDDLLLELWFQAPDGWLTSPPAAAVRFILLQNDGGWRFRPRLDAEGLGIGLAGKDGAALVASDIFRLGSARAHTFFGFGFHPWDADFDGAGVRLGGVGLPLNQLTGGSGSNGVVSGLLSGGDAGDGEPSGAQPALDIDLWYVEGAFHIDFNGEPGPYWLAVQSAFGPLYIEQVGIGLMQQGGETIGVDLLVDGGVSLAGLSVMVDDLTLGVPFRSIGRPQDWSIDLAGLAISYDSSGVKIAGGLTKSEEGGNVEYLGMLLVEVQSFGLVAIGAWGSMNDEEGEYTSFFVFAALFLTISFPPYLEIRGIGLGFGYNRRLVVPDDINKIPEFALVAALDSAGSFLENPMAALQAMRQQVPARRGSYWFAVGFHGTTFVVVHITAVVYVALDGGVEIGILGVARMMLPTADTALVSIELALKARYSSSEGLLSIQGQLTDNSWLLSRDCQLTGGFAFFMWFERGQFLITIGGYHPAFQREPEFPEVPRVGLRWDLGPIHIKGESYFALTNSAVMAGISVEASYSLGSWLRVWFKAWADFLLQWDPFYYDISIGVSLGARVTFTINLLFGKVKITLSLELGAELRVFGPPLRGVVKAKLGPFSVTVAFGSSSDEPNYISWPAFRDKYVLSEDTTAAATGIAPGKGLLQPEEKGADPPTGLENDPWRFNPDFGLRTETKMPSSKWQGPFNEGPQSKSGVDDLDAVPMDAEDLEALHIVTIERKIGGEWQSVVNRVAANLPDLDVGKQVSIVVQIESYPEAVWRRGEAAAASRNISAIGAVRMSFASITVGDPTEQIPITTLIDEGPRAPNPFTVRRAGHGLFRDFARQAVDLIAGASINDSWGIAATFLARGGLFDEQREALGLKSSGGLDARGLQTLARRTTPPSLGSLSTGLTMEPVVFDEPPVLERVLPKAPVELASARLRAEAVLPAAAARAAGTSLRTTVSGASDVPRVLPPSLKDGVAANTLGARLVRVPPAGSIPPTRASRPALGGAAARTGRPTSKRRAARIESLEERASGDGLTLAPGDIQHWELPTHDRRWTLTFNGDSVGVRVLFLGRGSRVLSDAEHVLGGTLRLDVPEKSRQAVVIALGAVSAEVPAGMGAVSGAYTPGGVAALGWQADSTVFVATRSVLVARGARIRLGGPSRAEAGRTAIASRALAAKGVVETRFPAVKGTLVVLADRVGAGTAEPPEVGIVGGTLSAPLRESNGRRHTWLYEIEPDPENVTVRITTAFGSGWTPGGVVLMPGGAPAGVGARLNGDAVPRFVSDGPIAARGSLRLSLSSVSRSEEE